MTWKIPRTQWATGEIPGASDFNRIEENIDYLHQNYFRRDGTIPMTDVLAFNKPLSAANKIIDMQQGYGLYSDFVDEQTRLWFDAPDTGEVHFGGRASVNLLDRFRVRSRKSEFEGKVIATYPAPYGDAIFQAQITNDVAGFGLYSNVRKWDIINIVSTAKDYFGVRDSTVGLTRFVITEDGYMGRGTTQPQCPFENVGKMRVSGDRPIELSPAIGNVEIKGGSGGWAIGYKFAGYGGTYFGGFGASGNADTLAYYYIGDDYSDPVVRIYPQGSPLTSFKDRIGISGPNPIELNGVEGKIQIGDFKTPTYDVIAENDVKINPNGHTAIPLGQNTKDMYIINVRNSAGTAVDIGCSEEKNYACIRFEASLCYLYIKNRDNIERTYHYKVLKLMG